MVKKKYWLKTFTRYSCIIALLCLLCLFSTFISSPKAHASSGPGPQTVQGTVPCLGVSPELNFQDVAVLPLGYGWNFNIVVQVKNNCGFTLIINGKWASVQNGTCPPDNTMQAGPSNNGTMSAIGAGQAETVLNVQEETDCIEYNGDGIPTAQIIPNSVTLSAQASAFHRDSVGREWQAIGQGTTTFTG